MSVKFMLIKGEVEDSSRCMLLRQTAKATQAEKRLVENIRKLLEKTSLIVLTDEAFPKTVITEIDHGEDSIICELEVDNANVNMRLEYQFGATYEIIPVLAIYFAKLNHSLENVKFDLDIDKGEMALNGRYTSDKEFDEKNFLKWFAHMNDLAFEEHEHIQELVERMIPSCECGVYRGYVAACLRMLNERIELRKHPPIPWRSNSDKPLVETLCNMEDPLGLFGLEDDDDEQ